MKNWRDLQSILYLGTLPGLVILTWIRPDISLLTYPIILVLTIGVCCISHNHAHLPIWENRWLNRLTDMWIGVLQGHPVYMFQPAHIESHHRYNQGDEDLTRVLRYASENNLLGYLKFPFQVIPKLSRLKKYYLKNLWSENKSDFLWVILLHVPLYILWIIVLLMNPYKALVFIFIPQIIGLHFLLASNYLQHAHAVPQSRYNHSRNFTGFINWVWFNVGYHTAHHQYESVHWTQLPRIHKDITKHINPQLNESSLISYVLTSLVLGSVVKRFQSKQL